MATMDIETDDDILRKVASGGSMDYSAWPQLLTDIVSRIEKIAHNDFPIPSIPPPSTAPPPPEPRFLAPLPSSDPIEPPEQDQQRQSGTTATESQDSSSQDTNKENAVPPTTSAASAPETAALQADDTPLEPGALPPQITAMLAEIKTTLIDGFPVYPPHTIQRLAELVLAPRQHYRSLPSYLHAVDRVVHVTSGANIYPLPPAIPDMSAMSLLANGVGSRGGGGGGDDSSSGSSLAWANAASAGAAVGSDEALGGALLTPIPWLQRRANGGGSDASPTPTSPSSEGGASSQSPGQVGGAQTSQQRAQGGGRQFEGQVRTESTETIEGPNGMGSIETVSVSVNGIPSMGAARALTQGEILRQEQRAGVVPVSQLARSGGAMTATASPLSSSSSAGQPTPTASSGSTGSSLSPSPEGPELTPSSGDEEMAGAVSTGVGAPSSEDVPHARGPEEIGAADTGPQSNTSSSYMVGSGGGVEMRGIDVEAAVGRKAEHSHSPEPAPAASALSPSAKREGDEDIDSDAPAQKKVKEQEGDDVAGGSQASGEEATESSRSAEEEPKKDAEGDIVLSDEVNESTEPASETAGSSGMTDGGGGGEASEQI